MSEERLEGQIVELQSLCVILLDRHCRDRRIRSSPAHGVARLSRLPVHRGAAKLKRAVYFPAQTTCGPHGCSRWIR